MQDFDGVAVENADYYSDNNILSESLRIGQREADYLTLYRAFSQGQFVRPARHLARSIGVSLNRALV